MDGWKTPLKADPTDWLLERENPSVRYFTLRDILDAPEDDAEFLAARQAIMRTGLVPAILGKQQDGEYRKPFRGSTPGNTRDWSGR